MIEIEGTHKILSFQQKQLQRFWRLFSTSPPHFRNVLKHAQCPKVLFFGVLWLLWSKPWLCKYLTAEALSHASCSMRNRFMTTNYCTRSSLTLMFWLTYLNIWIWPWTWQCSTTRILTIELLTGHFHCSLYMYIIKKYFWRMHWTCFMAF